MALRKHVIKLFIYLIIKHNVKIVAKLAMCMLYWFVTPLGLSFFAKAISSYNL